MLELPFLGTEGLNCIHSLMIATTIFTESRSGQHMHSQLEYLGKGSDHIPHALNIPCSRF